MNNVTLIDDLPTLEELDFQQSPGIGMIPPNEANKYQKFIRNSGYSTPPQSGMNVSSNNQQKMQDPRFNEKNMEQRGMDYNNQQRGMDYNNQQRGMDYNNQQRGMDNNNQLRGMDNDYQPYYGERFRENFEETPPPNKYRSDITMIGSHNCVDIAEHTENCLVCSKLYANNNTLYIIMIIFLAVVNLLLLKRILETGH